MMAVLGATDSLDVITSDESIKIQCGRNAEAATCAMRFTPSVSAEQLGVTPSADLEVSFESSMQDFL
ncbi:hypothetical protein QJS83_12180 [Bdellovibrio sp. 22V]|uniref:hypothetical protein n=1 Tax=Bdellovibrio TaxID=958 RepID=UPI002542B5C1|nr:hypothetical protein [Bdellovibrio sp. 22V]WII71218.1 hypothetical protein QJS83_12180 [Bdellovibrio sp. 22V]